MASYRAIEEGLPMVRATPTGISAFIDAFAPSRRGQRLGEGAFGVIDAPAAAGAAPTPFNRFRRCGVLADADPFPRWGQVALARQKGHG